MSDIPGGTTGGDTSGNPTIKFVIDTTDSKRAVIEMTAFGNSVKRSMAEADASVKLVSKSLTVMNNNARALITTQKTMQSQIAATTKAQSAAAAAALSAQNHQQRIALANLQQQHRMAMLMQRQQAGAGGRGGAGGAGGGWQAAWGTSGLLQGLGTLGKALGGGGGGGLLGGLVGLGAGGFVGGAIVGQITALVKNFVEAAASADALAASYARQNVAARGLAGSQEELNALLVVYDEATGGVLSKQKQLAGVTNLLSVGFADNSRELEQSAKAIRGISLARGRDPDAVQNDLILEMFTQRGQRLDQLGLQYDIVRVKTRELMEANASLTKQQAYQMAVLDHAAERYGHLADSAEGQATEVERLAAAYEDLGLAIANSVRGPVNLAAGAIADVIERVKQDIEELTRIKPENFSRTGDVRGGIWEGEKGSHSLAEAQAIKLGA